MKEIELNRGYTAIVDDEKYESVSQYNWRFYKTTGNISTNISRQGKRMTIPLPRFLMDIDDPGIRIGYMNGDVFDNRISNLKIMGKAQIVAKTGKRTGRFSSKYKGVSWDKRKGKWCASIHYLGKRYFLRNCDSEVEAAQVYDAAARYLHGDLAYQNFPDQPKVLLKHASLPAKAGQRKRKTTANTSRFIGVSPQEGHWHCQLRHNGKTFTSYHNTEADAAYAYDKLAIEHRGVDAIVNFPDHWRRQRQQFP